MKRIVALVMCMLMLLAVMVGCGGKEEAAPAPAAPAAPAAEEAAPAAPEAPAAPAAEEAPAAPAGDASGEASGEASGDPPAMRTEAVDPTGYTPDFAGYKQYALSAVAELEAQSGLDLSSFKSEIEAAADETAAVFANMQSQNTIVTFADFVAAN